MKTKEHPTVRLVQERVNAGFGKGPAHLSAQLLRKMCLQAGADDVGFVEIDRPALSGEAAEVKKHFPQCKSMISFVCKMNRGPIRSPARSVANLEFHQVGDKVNEVGNRVVAALEEMGVDAINPSMGFPMEMDRFPGRIWVVSHKLVAQEAGLGVMGIHRNVIHPKFGNFILLGTVLVDAEVSEYGRRLDYNPCLECKLCVAACPVGAIGADGQFNFNACYTHNYREFMGGFSNWAETVAESKDRFAYRQQVSDSESASMWQSLSFGANYKAAYCLSVCPAGEDVLAPFLADKKQFLADHVRPLQEKKETIYVIRGSDAESHVTKRFPSKRVKFVDGSLRARTIEQFVEGLRHFFQPGASKGLEASYHFTFTGKEERKVTIEIRGERVRVVEGHEGEANLRITTDSEWWLGFLAKERSLFWGLIRRKIWIWGNPGLLVRFGRCFPT